MSQKTKQQLVGIKFSRIQSSSSINTFRQCPRKYFYHYVLGLPSKPSIHLVRGHVAHSVLEDFFKIPAEAYTENYDFQMKIFLHDMLSKLWNESEDELVKLNMKKEEINFYFTETKDMLQKWLIDFLKDLKNEIETNSKSFVEAFNLLKPIAEEHFLSDEIGVQGYIDAIHKNSDGTIKIIDYKTSKRDHMSDEYKLQLAMYAILYHEKYHKYPKQVGLYLLRHGERLLDVDEELLEFARKELKKVHLATISKEINDYPKKKSFLCKWRTGQCDYYKECMKDELNIN